MVEKGTLDRGLKGGGKEELGGKSESQSIPWVSGKLRMTRLFNFTRTQEGRREGGFFCVLWNEGGGFI